MTDQSVRLLRPPGLFAGAPYAYAAVVQAPERVVLTAGACPIDADGVLVGPGDVRAQAAQALANLRAALTEGGASLADVVMARVYVATTEQRDLLAVWQVVHDGFDGHEPPGTLLGVTVLGFRGQLVEIEAVAVPGSSVEAP